MKKWFLILAASTLLACGAMADDWEWISIGFTEDVPSDAATTTVCGVKVGAPICGGTAPVYGVEAAVLWAGTECVNGFKGSLIACGGKEVKGLQFSLINLAEKVGGLQLGIFNSAKSQSFQIGILNHIEDACIPWMPVLNFKF